MQARRGQWVCDGEEKASTSECKLQTPYGGRMHEGDGRKREDAPSGPGGAAAAAALRASCRALEAISTASAWSAGPKAG